MEKSLNMMVVKNRLSWDEYFMGIAMMSAKRSEDPNTKVGCCIVDSNNHIVSIGYNGMPSGIDDFSWKRESKDPLDTKYPYVVHSELNAILNSKRDLEGCKIYVTLFPCNECTKAIVQAGIKEVIYFSDKYMGTDSNIAAKRILQKKNIPFRQFQQDLELVFKVDGRTF